MRIQEDRRSAVALSAEDVAHQAASHGIQPRGRLVQEYQLRVVNQRLGQPDTLEHALGKVGQTFVPMRCESHQFKERGNTIAQRARRHAGEAPMQFQKFACRQPLVEAEILGRNPILRRVSTSPAGASRTIASPLVGRTRPSSILIDVLFPAPFGPRKPKILPRRTVNERPRTATLFPKSLRKFCVRTA